MSRTQKKEPKKGDEDIQKIKNKLKDRKSQNLRLKRTIRTLESRIRELENKIDGEGNVKPGKKRKTPLKLSEKQKKEQGQKDLREKLKKQFGGKK